MAHDSPNLADSTKQLEVVIPDLTIKELLGAIPWVAHRSSSCTGKNLTNFFQVLIASSVTDGGPLSTCPSYIRFSVCQFPVLIVSLM